MNAINPIDFGTTGTSSASNKSPYDQELAVLEKFIDKMVTAEKNMAKADAESARQKAELLSEYEKKLAFLTGQIHKLQSELAALEGSRSQSALPAPPTDEKVDSKKQELLYWKSKLRGLVEGCESGDNL